MRRVTSLVLVAMASCTVDASKLAANEVCELNSECAAPLVCRLGRCREQCFETRDCPLNAGCVQDNDGFGICIEQDESECAQSSDCPEPLICAAERCVNECGTNRDCPPGTTCRDGGCEDPARDNRCVYHDDCSDPYICDQGVCRAECRADRDCELPGFACVEMSVEGRVGGICTLAD